MSNLRKMEERGETAEAKSGDSGGKAERKDDKKEIRDVGEHYDSRDAMGGEYFDNRSDGKSGAEHHMGDNKEHREHEGAHHIIAGRNPKV